MDHGRALVVLCLVIVLVSPTSVVEAGVSKTGGPLSTTFTLPSNESVSALLIWTDHQDTTIEMDVSAMYNYTISMDVSQTGIWHIAFFYQPYILSSNVSSIKVPSLERYITFTADRIEEVKLSSDNEVYWMPCESIYSCSLQPPLLMVPTQDSTTALVGLIAVSVMCFMFLVTTVVLAVLLLRKRNTEKHYEKAFWPPVSALPPPHPERLTQFLDEHLNEVRTRSQGTPILRPVSAGVANLRASRLEVANPGTANFGVTNARGSRHGTVNSRVVSLGNAYPGTANFGAANAGYVGDFPASNHGSNHPRAGQVAESSAWNDGTEDPRAAIIDHESIGSTRRITIR